MMLSEYISELDKIDKDMYDRRAATTEVTKLLDEQLVHLDCSRVSATGMRLMQTIGAPYQRELSVYVYLLEKLDGDDRDIYEEKLIDRHNQNLEYETLHPPINYYNKPLKKLPRKRNVDKRSSAPVSNTDRVKNLKANFANIKFKIKLK